jgi:hypothetical protein
MLNDNSPIIKWCWSGKFALVESENSVPRKFKTGPKLAVESQKSGLNGFCRDSWVSLDLVESPSILFNCIVAVQAHITQDLSHDVGNVCTGIDGLWQHVIKGTTLLCEIKSTEHLSNPTWPHLASRWPLPLISAIMESWPIAQSSRR